MFIIELENTEELDQGKIFLSIIECLDYSICKNLYWSFLDFDGVGDLRPYTNIPELCKKAYDLKHGYIVDWEILNILSHRFRQIINLILVGAHSIDDIEHKPDEMDYYLSYPIVISNLDGYLWAVSTIYKEIADKVQKKFPYTRLLKEGDKLKGK